MNEQIRELAEQAGFDDRGSNHTAYMNFDHEKFAELIVRECVDIADEYDGVGSTIVSRIRKHFGVEE